MRLLYVFVAFFLTTLSFSQETGLLIHDGNVRWKAKGKLITVYPKGTEIVVLQSKGSYILDQEDFKGLSRFQINDSNWKVCKQSPAPGKSVPVSTVVTLYSVKLTERC